MYKEVEETVFEVLAHPIRRDILKLLSRNEEGVSYTDILGEVTLSTGKLNYHLKQMDGFIEKDNFLRYNLTPLGKSARDLMHHLESDLPNDVESYVTIRKPPSLMPAMKAMACIMIVVVSIPVVFASIELYSAIIEQSQLLDILSLVVILSIGVAILVWIVYMLFLAPGFIKNLERRLYE
ncbi:MAG: winged helix-turn-helix domain-containing protein [Candidatus Thorarchaeota archaeon]